MEKVSKVIVTHFNSCLSKLSTLEKEIETLTRSLFEFHGFYSTLKKLIKEIKETKELKENYTDYINC